MVRVLGNGGRVRVTLSGGVRCVVARDTWSYGAGDPQYSMMADGEGYWEPICAAGDPYLTDDFLAGATVEGVTS